MYKHIISILIVLLFFPSCKKSSNNKTNAQYLEKGLQHAINAKNTLGKNLISAIQKNGSKEALSFCSLNAIKLTDSISKHEKVKIKRVSNKYRNSQNKPNTEEIKYIKKVEEQLSSKGIVTPQVSVSENSAIAFYPILTNDLCLQCHGVPLKDIPKQTFDKIKELYPNDLAINYKSNELRGIWVIEMEK